MSHDNAQGSTPQDEAGVDRRKFILGTAAASAGMWAAPSILSVDRAFAGEGSPQPNPPRPVTCTTSAFALSVVTTGPVPLNLGPSTFSSCATGGTPFEDANVANGLVIATFLDTECTQNPCRAFAEVLNLSINLTSLNVPLVLTASVIRATALCTGRSSSIADLFVGVGDAQPAEVNVGTAPNVEVVDIDTDVLDLKVVLNEQVGTTVNAIHITASVTVLGVTQTVDIIVASATATCT